MKYRLTVSIIIDPDNGPIRTPVDVSCALSNTAQAIYRANGFGQLCADGFTTQNIVMDNGDIAGTFKVAKT